MKRQQIIKSLISLTLIISICTVSSAQKKAIVKPISYKLDHKQSKVLWKGPKSVGNKHYGYLLLVSGILNEDANGKFKNGDFVLDMNSIRSTDYKEAKKRKEVDDLLISNDFFAAAHYPTGQMKIKTITATAQADKYKVVGDLSIKGTTAQIEFIAVIKRVGNRILVQGSLTIDRHTWGIDSKKNTEVSIFKDFRDKLITDEIPISLNLILNKS